VKQNKKVKLVQITHDLDLGGLQRVIVNLCRTINRDIFDVSVLCLRNLGCYTEEVQGLGVPVTLIEQKQNGTDYLSFLKVAEYLRTIRPDVIHTHNTQPFVDGTMGALLAGGIKTIVHTDHARDFPDKIKYMFAEWLVSHFAYKVVGVSKHTVYNLHRYERIPRKKTVVITNGIYGPMYELEIDKNKKKQELEISTSSKIIGVAVRLDDQKGLTYLIKAMPEVLKKVPDTVLLIAGDGPLAADLKEEAKHLQIESKIRFLGIRLDIPELLSIFDIMVLPSLWEGLPMIILEAMAARCPILATRVGGVATAIENDKTGVLVPSKNPAILAEKILALLKDEQKRLDLAKNAKELFEEKFSARTMAVQYEKIYLRQT